MSTKYYRCKGFKTNTYFIMRIIDDQVVDVVNCYNQWHTSYHSCAYIKRAGTELTKEEAFLELL